jgi:hypothetical protein
MGVFNMSETLPELMARLFDRQLESNEKINRYYVKLPSADARRISKAVAALLGEIEWWRVNHACCAGHDDETLARIDKDEL